MVRRFYRQTPLLFAGILRAPAAEDHGPRDNDAW